MYGISKECTISFSAFVLVMGYVKDSVYSNTPHAADDPL
jgi:hypothetical protein